MPTLLELFRNSLTVHSAGTTEFDNFDGTDAKIKFGKKNYLVTGCEIDLFAANFVHGRHPHDVLCVL